VITVEHVEDVVDFIGGSSQSPIYLIKLI